MSKKIQALCITCGINFEVYRCNRKEIKFCSRQCHGVAQKEYRKTGKDFKCKACDQLFYRAAWQIQRGVTYCSRKCMISIRSKLRGSNSPRWKKDNNLTYSSLHYWLRRTFGNATYCELCGITKAPKNKQKFFQWAKLHGKEYERKRENFWMLCIKCHKTYDRE